MNTNTNTEKLTKAIRVWAINPKARKTHGNRYDSIGLTCRIAYTRYDTDVKPTTFRKIEKEIVGFLADSAPLAVDLREAATAGMLAARLIENVPELAN